MSKYGIASLIIGVFILAYANIMNTSVISSRVFDKHGNLELVHNIGLLNSRTNYSILGGIFFLAGVVLFALGRNRPLPPASLVVKDEGEPRTSEQYSGEADLQSSSYQLFLTKRYGIEKNNTLDKYIFDEQVFDSLDQALSAAHVRYHDEIKAAEKEREESDVRKRVEDDRRRTEVERKHAENAILGKRFAIIALVLSVLGVVYFQFQGYEKQRNANLEEMTLCEKYYFKRYSEQEKREKEYLYQQGCTGKDIRPNIEFCGRYRDGLLSDKQRRELSGLYMSQC